MRKKDIPFGRVNEWKKLLERLKSPRNVKIERGVKWLKNKLKEK